MEKSPVWAIFDPSDLGYFPGKTDYEAEQARYAANEFIMSGTLKEGMDIFTVEIMERACHRVKHALGVIGGRSRDYYKKEHSCERIISQTIIVELLNHADWRSVAFHMYNGKATMPDIAKAIIDICPAIINNLLKALKEYECKDYNS